MPERHGDRMRSSLEVHVAIQGLAVDAHDLPGVAGTEQRELSPTEYGDPASGLDALPAISIAALCREALLQRTASQEHHPCGRPVASDAIDWYGMDQP